jgi:hypothetical protein
MAKVRLATGRPESVVSAGAAIEVVSGHRVRRFGLCSIAGSSSKTKMPSKLLE